MNTPQPSTNQSTSQEYGYYCIIHLSAEKTYVNSMTFYAADSNFKPSGLEPDKDLVSVLCGNEEAISRILKVSEEQRPDIFELEARPYHLLKVTVIPIAGHPGWLGLVYLHSAGPDPQASGDHAAASPAVTADTTLTSDAVIQLKEHIAMLQSIANAVPDMLYVIDMKQIAITYANDKMLRMAGKSLPEIQKLDAAIFDEIVYKEDRPQFDEAFQSLMTTKDDAVITLTFRMVDNNGELHWVTDRRSVFRRDQDGNPLFALGITQEIAEQVKLKERNRKLTTRQKQVEEKNRQDLFKAILDTQEEERKRISETLHNDLGQLLYGVKISLDHTIKRAKHTHADTTELHKTEKLLADAIRESRRMSHELMPTVLEDFGLRAALKNICDQLSVTTDCRCIVKGSIENLDRYMQTAVYRIAQEFVLNIMKHARASKAYLEVTVSDREVKIVASDNGIGFDLKQQTTGIGLKAIKNRMKMLKGSFVINSTQKGSIATVIIPRF